MKLYQLSVRSQYTGRALLAAWTRSTTLIVADCVGGRGSLERVPRMSVRNCPARLGLDRGADADEAAAGACSTPRRPPAARRRGRRRPVFRNTTARYGVEVRVGELAPRRRGRVDGVDTAGTGGRDGGNPGRRHGSEVLVTTRTLYGSAAAAFTFADALAGKTRAGPSGPAQHFSYQSVAKLSSRTTPHEGQRPPRHRNS